MNKSLKDISSTKLCEELNYRHGRIERNHVPKLRDFETVEILAELIDRGCQTIDSSNIKSGVHVMKVTGDDVFDPRIQSNDKLYGFTLEAPAFFISFKAKD